MSVQVFLSGAGVQVSGEGGAGLYVRNVLSERRNLAKVFHCGVAGLRCIKTLLVVVVEGGAWLLSCSYDFHVFSAAVAVRAAHEPCIALVLFGTISTLCLDKYYTMQVFLLDTWVEMRTISDRESGKVFILVLVQFSQK